MTPIKKKMERKLEGWKHAIQLSVKGEVSQISNAVSIDLDLWLISDTCRYQLNYVAIRDSYCFLVQK